MRSAIVGTYFHDRPEPRRAFARAIAQVTHRDDRAVEGACFVAEVAAACAASPTGELDAARLEAASGVVANAELGRAIQRARELASRKANVQDAAESLGTTGFVVHTVPFALFCLLRLRGDPLPALTEAIRVGGDTDSIAAILGGWLGALHGEAGLPGDLLGRLQDGPFGPTHLRALATCLARVRAGQAGRVPEYSPTVALARNLALYPVVLAHGLRRLVPF